MESCKQKFISLSNNMILKITNLPIDIMIMILERLQLEDSSNLCTACHIPAELAFQYHLLEPDYQRFYEDWKDDYKGQP